MEPRSPSAGPRTRAPAVRAAARSAVRAGWGAALAAAWLFAGCGGEPGGTGESAPSDTAAFEQATAVEDTTARIEALRSFLDEYPESALRAPAYSRLGGLLQARSPSEAADFARSRLESESTPAGRGRLHYILYTHARDEAPAEESAVIEAVLADPNVDAPVYNMIAWNLVEREEHLEDAVRLAAKGAEQAPDSLSKAMVLDTEGWALYLLGRYDQSAERLRQALDLHQDDELRSHLAMALDKAGEQTEARDLYKELLYSQEDPEYRNRAEALTQEMGQSVTELRTEIDRRREEAARPAPDFTLPNLEGQEIRLADYQGKVVLLNFWHPT